MNGQPEIIDPESLSERATNTIQRPHYWRDAGQLLIGNADKEYAAAFLKVQQRLHPVILADKENAFTKSDYASLAAVLSYVRPILHDEGFILRQMAGEIRVHGESSKRWPALPIATHLYHVESGQWEMSVVPMPFEAKSISIAAAMTFGKRIGLLSYFGIATSDDDGMAVLQGRIDQEASEAAAAGIIATIEECDTQEGLQAWLAKNDEGLKMISEASLALVRKAYTARKKELPEPEKAGDDC